MHGVFSHHLTNTKDSTHRYINGRGVILWEEIAKEGTSLVSL